MRLVFTHFMRLVNRTLAIQHGRANRSGRHNQLGELAQGALLLHRRCAAVVQLEEMEGRRESRVGDQIRLCKIKKNLRYSICF